jgi:hypothetical protein
MNVSLRRCQHALNIFLIVLNAGNRAIVLDSDEQFTAIGVGKRNERFGNILANVFDRTRPFVRRFACESAFEFSKVAFTKLDRVSDALSQDQNIRHDCLGAGIFCFKYFGNSNIHLHFEKRKI